MHDRVDYARALNDETVQFCRKLANDPPVPWAACPRP